MFSSGAHHERAAVRYIDVDRRTDAVNKQLGTTMIAKNERILDNSKLTPEHVADESSTGYEPPLVSQLAERCKTGSFSVCENI